MTVKSWLSVAAGAFIALVVPISILVLARLAEVGIADPSRMHALTSPLLAVVWLEAFLGPLGIVIAGRSGHVRARGAWVILSLFAGAALAYLSLDSLLLFGQFTGSPF
jgi:hypothetical protein